MRKFDFRRVLVAVLVCLAMLAQATWALAGTTGGMNGTVTDADTSAPIANAKVTISSPSGTYTTQTDGSGHFVILSLGPDTYSVSVEKEGYATVSQPGVTVFADAQARVSLKMTKELKTIARVTATAGGLVHSGTTADVYSVNASTQDKISALGGGGSLNSAYSAVASVPGAVMPLNQTGYYQTVHIRGGDFDQVGYELDGVPVNRSFDNYPSGALPSLGMQELQVYTGAAPSNSEGQGLAGFINQVIKSGTYPGFGTLTGGIGSPTYYHKASGEAGGASPNRLFSYYAGVGGYNQAFRYVDQYNAAKYQNLGPPLTQLAPPDAVFDPSSGTFTCPGSVVDWSYSLCYANSGGAGVPNNFAVGPGGYQLLPYTVANPATITNRDVVVNLHFALPHKHDGGRDDVQLLYDSGMLLNPAIESTNDLGGPDYFTPAVSSGAIPSLPTYLDSFFWSGPVGTALPANYQQFAGHYFYPNQPTNRQFQSVMPFTLRDGTWNNQEIVKLQYQKNIGTAAYVRLYGYTYYSDWLQNGPTCSFNAFYLYGDTCFASPDYELSSHTRGLSLTFADQLNAQHLLTVQGSYTTASTVRDNNTQMFNLAGTRSRFAVAVDALDPLVGICYDSTGAATSCTPAAPHPAQWATLSQAFNGTIAPLPPSCTNPTTGAADPCEYLVAENSLYATYNTVKPQFTAASITDQWRPLDRLLLDFGFRWDRYEFDGSNTHPNDPARQFWFNAFNQENCIQNTTGAPFDKVIALGLPSPASACPAGFSTPNLQNTSAQINAYQVWEPRISGTYTFNPDTVLRFSYGRYAEPPNTAYEQYNTLQENLADFLGANFYKYGFTTPGHFIVPPVSNNYDLSLEQRIKNTDWSFKLTPFYRQTQDQIQNFFLNQQTGFISGLNVGRQTSQGFEFQLNKGDFTRNGLSAQLSFTYTHSAIQYNRLQNGTTVVSQINQDISNYNSFTSFCASNPADSRCVSGTQLGKAAPCYTTAGAPDPACAAGDVASPYWNAPVQKLLDPNALYPTYDIFPGGIGGSASSFSIPYAAVLVLSYKHNKFAVTPSFQYLAGNVYGSPESNAGIDPTAGCGALTGGRISGDPRYPYGALGGAPYDATTCGGTIVIPNTFTHVFDLPGSFRNPDQFLMNLQLSYDVTPKVSLVATLANIVNTCSGGSRMPWYIADGNVCSYGIINNVGDFSPVGNVYNWTPAAQSQFQRLVQYPYGAYLGGTNIFNSPPTTNKTPFQFFIEARVKM